jgi:hypothetical protein
VVDDEEQRKAAHKLGYKRTLIVESTDIAAKRTAIHINHGSGWYISMDDNIRSFNAVSLNHRYEERLQTNDPSWRTIFKTLCKPAEYLGILKELQAQCSKHGTVYGGVANMENHFFRGSARYTTSQLIKGKVFVMHGGADVTWKYPTVEDVYMTSLVMAKYGCTVMDRRAHYIAKSFEAGGLGSLKERFAAGLINKLRDIADEFEDHPNPSKQLLKQRKTLRKLVEKDKDKLI